MSTDRELLELAAKAAGMPFITGCYDAGMGLCVSVGNDEDQEWWNPLFDDGDALRLAAKLGIDVTYKAFGEDEVMTSASEDQFEGWFTEPYGDDNLQAATRRAIVRAAAEIGKGMS